MKFFNPTAIAVAVGVLTSSPFISAEETLKVSFAKDEACSEVVVGENTTEEEKNDTLGKFSNEGSKDALLSAANIRAEVLTGSSPQSVDKPKEPQPLVLDEVDTPQGVDGFEFHDNGMDQEIDEDDSEEEIERNLEGHSSHFLSNTGSGECNEKVDEIPLETCLKFSEMVETAKQSSSQVKIDCGKCAIVDISDGSTIDLPGGLNIVGKLYFPNTASVSIKTVSVIVQGILEVEPPEPGSESAVIPHRKQKVTITLYGEEPLSFVPDGINANACGGSPCEIGKKSVFVAGGTLRINAMDPNCPSYAKLSDVIDVTSSAPTPPTLPFEAKTPPADCDSSGIIIGNGSFEDDTNNWSCRYGCSSSRTSSDDGYFLSTKHRWRPQFGPVRYLKPEESGCIIPDQTYILSGRFRLVPEDPLYTTECSTTGDSCPSFDVVYHSQTSNNLHIRTLGKLNKAYRHVVVDGEWVHFALQVKFLAEEVGQINYMGIVMNKVEVEVGLDIDDFVLRLPSESSVPGVANGCESLSPADGTAESLNNGVSAYPFTISGASGAFLQIHKEETTEGYNKFFAVRGRESNVVGLEYDVPSVKCLVQDQKYKISMKYRLHNETAEHSPEINVKYVDPDGVTVMAGDSSCAPSKWHRKRLWTECEVVFKATEHIINSPSIAFGAYFWTDHNSDIDFDDINVELFREGDGTVHAITVSDANAAKCWGKDAELVITSDTTKPYHYQTVTVTSVNTATGQMTVEVPFDRIPTSMKKDPDHAAEVALLNRNFIIDAIPDVGNDLIGGSLVVYRSPSIPQQLNGVELRRMGQQGTMGKYPVHFQMSANSPESVVSKNVIRQSNQRCIVIQGTHNVTIEQNVAFDTFGHCYVLADGGEYDNKFKRNLGIMTKTVSKGVAREVDGSDFDAATFVLANPMNIWEGNIAAGSERHGYLMEFPDAVRGESALLTSNQGVKPSCLPIGSFKGNIAHSNERYGVTTTIKYGFRPTERQYFEYTRSYRNDLAGMYLQNTDKVTVSGGHFSDNRGCVRIVRSNDIIVENVKCIMLSEDFGEKLDSSHDILWNCEKPDLDRKVPLQVNLAGITFTPTQDLLTGATITNTAFEGFADTKHCTGFAIEAEVHYLEPKVMTTAVAVSELSFDSYDRSLSVCHAANSPSNEEKNMAIEDYDGTLSGTGTPGYMVQDGSGVLSLLPGCTKLPDSCMSHCPGACLRNLMVRTAATPNFDDVVMEITNSEGLVAQIPKVFNGDPLSIYDDAIYAVYLPSGDLDISFKKNGQPVWPSYVKPYFERQTECAHGTQVKDLNFVFPAAGTRCSNAIMNGDFESGNINGWTTNHAGLESLEGGADGSKFALKTTARNQKGYLSAVRQWLDISCLRDIGYVDYEISGDLRLIDATKGFVDVKCNMAKGWKETTACPQLEIGGQPWNSDDLVVETGMKCIIGKVQTKDDGSWSRFNMVFSVPDSFDTSDLLHLEMRGNGKMEYYLDNLSLKKADYGDIEFTPFSANLELAPTSQKWIDAMTMNRERLLELMKQSPNGIIRRNCPKCAESHRTIFYKRRTDPPADMADILERCWKNTNNDFHSDFDLYSTYQDAVNDVNEWSFCKFDGRKGFPSSCGPSGAVGGQTNDFDATRGLAVLFSVETSKKPESARRRALRG